VSYAILRDPEQIRNVVTMSKQASDGYSRLEQYDKVYGAPKVALDLYRKQSIGGKENSPINHAHCNVSSKYLTGAPLVSLVDKYASILSRNLNDKMFQVGSWTQIEDFWSFMQQVQTRCTMEALFGSALFKQYPRVVRDYWEFDTAVDSFLPGAPHFIISAASRPRERLQAGIEKWLKTNHSGSEFAKIGDEDPDWDEHKGSKFIQERDDAIAKIEGLDIQARTAEILSVMHGYVPSVFHGIHQDDTDRIIQDKLASGLLDVLDPPRSPPRPRSRRTTQCCNRQTLPTKLPNLQHSRSS
jgi:hypothetical protein